jgi:hypothetical protein
MSQNFKTEHRKNINGKNHFEISTTGGKEERLSSLLIF